MYYWAWTPMLDDERIAKQLAEAIKSEEDLHRDDRLTVHVMEFDNIIPRVMGVIQHFDSCILLKKHVTRRPSGPYPSLRAERSIQTSWSACSLLGVKHYWPAASLAEKDYVRLDADDALAKAWGRYSRRHAFNRAA